MKKVTLYWNHICVLHNQEKKFLENIRKKLLLEDILLEITYFGLGYPEHMSEYLAKPEAVLPDLIVSADLEVFEDKRIFRTYKEELYNLEPKISYNDENRNLVYRNEKLIPFVAIPLVYYGFANISMIASPIHIITRVYIIPYLIPAETRDLLCIP